MKINKITGERELVITIYHTGMDFKVESCTYVVAGYIWEFCAFCSNFSAVYLKMLSNWGTLLKGECKIYYKQSEKQ